MPVYQNEQVIRLDIILKLLSNSKELYRRNSVVNSLPDWYIKQDHEHSQPETLS